MEVKCPNCGTLNDESAKFCKKCGSNLKQNNQPTYSQSPINQINQETKSDDSTKKYVIIGVVVIIIVLMVVGAVIAISMQNTSNSGNGVSNSVSSGTTSGGSQSSGSSSSGSGSNSGSSSSSDGSITIHASELQSFANTVNSQDIYWNSITWNGQTVSKPQACYILAKAISTGGGSDITVGSVSWPSNSHGYLTSGTINNGEYTDMASRVTTWIDSNGVAPNYVGVDVKGVEDLSFEKMTKLFAVVFSQNYPDSVTVESLI